jgi:hypothetical protein
MPVIRRNLFVQRDGGDFARLGEYPTAILPYTDESIAEQAYVGEDNLFFKKD